MKIHLKNLVTTLLLVLIAFTAFGSYFAYHDGLLSPLRAISGVAAIAVLFGIPIVKLQNLITWDWWVIAALMVVTASFYTFVDNIQKKREHLVHREIIIVPDR